jgi:hypothetical protein
MQKCPEPAALVAGLARSWKGAVDEKLKAATTSRDAEKAAKDSAEASVTYWKSAKDGSDGSINTWRSTAHDINVAYQGVIEMLNYIRGNSPSVSLI